MIAYDEIITYPELESEYKFYKDKIYYFDWGFGKLKGGFAVSQDDNNLVIHLDELNLDVRMDKSKVLANHYNEKSQ